MLSACTLTVHVTSQLQFHLKRNQDGSISKKLNILDETFCPFGSNNSKDIWVGWLGTNLEGNKLTTEVTNNIFPVHAEGSLINEYQEFCKEALSPFYYIMQGKPNFVSNKWKAYDEVNKILANGAWNACQSRNEEVSIWIHGYELLMTPHWLRQKLDEKSQRCKIGFRFYSGFPSWHVFKLLPLMDEILQGVLASDLITFETLTDCSNFIECCEKCLGCRVDRTKLLVEHGSRSVMVKQLPIPTNFDQLSKQSTALPLVSFKSKKVVLCINRMDDVLQTVNAFKTLLSDVDNIIIRLVTLPAQNNDILSQSTKELIKEINSSFSSSSIESIHNLQDQNELITLYKNADVCLVSMGLGRYAKEFVACQVASPFGVLVVPSFYLSETMPEAISFNPFDILNIAASLNCAIKMSEEEKCARMGSLRKREKLNASLGSLENIFKGTESSISKATLEDFKYLSEFIGNRRVVLLLDYDGTLAPIASHPDLAVLPINTKNVLENLCHHSHCFMSIISGRNINDVKKMVGIDNIVYAGNHGLEISFLDGTNYIYPMPSDTKQKIQAIQEELEKNVCPEGAWVENKITALTFHFRKVAENLHEELEQKARMLIEKAGFKVGKAHCAVEAKPFVDWNKGRAALHILNTVFGSQWYDNVAVFYIGDDVTDEDAIRVLKGLGFTYRVVAPTVTKTSADRRLASTEAVVTLLQWIEQYLNKKNNQ